MIFLNNFFHMFWHYIQELWLVLAVGFLLSGLFYTFLSKDFVIEHLGGKGIKPILIASIVGTILPVCCLGSLPIAITMKKKGASLGATLAFLVTTPATSISALFVTWKLLGLVFTFYIFVTVIIMGVVTGIICNRMRAVNVQEEEKSCCHAGQEPPDGPFAVKVKAALVYGFVTLPKEIGLEIIMGIFVASFIMVSDLFQQIIQEFLVGSIGYLVVVVIGILTYVCSTASVPMAQAFINSGMTLGQGLCYLVIGPITSYGTILVIKKEFGLNVLLVYLGIIIAFSLAAGLLLDSNAFINAYIPSP